MPPEEDQEVSLRDTLTEAFEKSEAPPETSETPETPEVPETPETPETEEDKVRKEADTPRARDPRGKFAKKEATAPEGEEKPEGEEPKTEQPRVEQPRTRAPGSWKPAAREKWATVPPEVQQEILRREREIHNGFNEVTNAKKFHDTFQQVVAPYQNIIAAEGGNPLKFVNDLMVTAGALYGGAPQQKAQVVAGLIKSFGVDIAMLDSILAGETPPAASQQNSRGNMDAAAFIQQEIQRAIAPLLQGNQQQVADQAASELEAFATDPKNEFFEDVKDTMADLLEVAAKQGRKMDLSTAYNRATMMHSEIAEIIEQRKLEAAAREASQKAIQAKRRAVSVTGAPAREPAGERPPSLRGDIEAAIEQLGT